jgi:nucleotide-binding universal stress UspA family protein
MLRTIHVALDGSRYAQSAQRLAIRWARDFGAKLLGQAPIDEPFITEAEAMPMGGTYFKGHRDEAKLAEATAKAQSVLLDFEKECAAAHLEAKRVKEVGEPVALIRQAAETADVTLIGRHTFFHFTASSDPCGSSDEVMHHPPRPVVVVPETLAEGKSIVIAYDGSAEAARALMAFQASGLGSNEPVFVVTVNESLDEAAAIADRAIRYLASHEINATPRPMKAIKDIGEHLLDEVTKENAQMLVMGAFSHSTLHEFIFGSTTKTVLHKLPVPVFLFH